jgi:peptidoglycan/xylan/chitin deacetylase (PgdA/CDA1 family)
MGWANLWRGWRGIRGGVFAVFNWHQVSPAFDPNRHHPYTWTSLADFEHALNFIERHFEVVPLTEGLERCRRRALQRPCAALTFDDGDASVAQHAEPCLRRRGLPATFFINSAYLDGRSTYWFPVLAYAGSALPEAVRAAAQELRHTADPARYETVRLEVERAAAAIPDLGSRLVAPAWLSALDERQFALGAHGHEHERFGLMPPEWQRRDLRENVARLSAFPAFRPVFAVPFGRAGDWNGQTLAAARELGLEVVLADGGANFGPAEAYRRMSCDGCRDLAPLVRRALAAR